MSGSYPFDDDEDEEEGTAILSSKSLGGLTKSREPQPFLVLLAGGEAGKMLRVEHEVVVGRSARAGLRLTGDGVSRFHARFFRQDGRTYVEDLGSTNGTRVNGERLSAPRGLQDGDKIQVGGSFLLKFSLQDELDQQFQQELFEAALRDPLTKAHNRRALVERMDSEVAHTNRHQSPLVFMLMDLDHFKRLNDTYGHLAGDKVLRDFAALVEGMTRKEDFFARYGGEEFALLCRSTALEAGSFLAERIRAAVEATEFVTEEGDALPVSVSIGLASCWAGAEVEELIEVADQALYAAKEQGRNRVVTAPSR